MVKKVQFEKGSYYHLMNRTPSGVLLFRDMDDYILFDKRATAYADECGFVIITRCLMPTHYHFLVRQDGDITPSKFMQKLSISYVNSYRHKYGHHGSLFGHRFGVVEILDRYQMSNTCLYIQVNGYEAGYVENPIDWPAGDLALFMSDKFWQTQTDPYLLDSFGSLEGFKEAYNDYMEKLISRKLIIHESCKSFG